MRFQFSLLKNAVSSPSNEHNGHRGRQDRTERVTPVIYNDFSSEFDVSIKSTLVRVRFHRTREKLITSDWDLSAHNHDLFLCSQRGSPARYQEEHRVRLNRQWGGNEVILVCYCELDGVEHSALWREKFIWLKMFRRLSMCLTRWRNHQTTNFLDNTF